MCKDDPEEARAEMDKVLAETSTPDLPAIDAGDLAEPTSTSETSANPAKATQEKTVDTTPSTGTVDGYTPVFSPMVRTVIYVLGVVISAAAFILLGLAGEVGWPHWVSTLAGLIGTAYGVVASGFGVAYRPTR